MAEQLIPRITMAEQIIKLPEELQFQAVKQTMELMANKKLMGEQKTKLGHKLTEMRFVFRETPAIPFKATKKLREEAPYVSQTREEFWARVLRKTVSKVIFVMVLLMAVKFVAVYRHTVILEQAGNFVTEHFLMVVGGILAGCAALSAVEVSHRDSVNASKLKRINDNISIYNRNIDKQNAEIQRKNLQTREADKKRRAEEEKRYQIKRREVQKLLASYEKAHQEVLDDIAQLRERNVMPRMFFEDGNKMLPVVYYLMQTREVTKLYDLDGALEKARSIIQEEKMSGLVQQIVNNTAQMVGQLNALNSRMQEVYDKLDSLGGQMSYLVTSQDRMNVMLTDVCQSSREAVAAIESQKSALEAQNKDLAGRIDKSIRENSLGRYVYDTSLFGTTINAKDIKKFVEGRS